MPHLRRRELAAVETHVEVRAFVDGEESLREVGWVLLVRIADHFLGLFEPVGFVDVLGCVDWPLLVAAYPGVGLLFLVEPVGFRDRGAELVVFTASHAGAPCS